MPTATQREAARRDLVEHFVYLAESAGLDVAERFLSNAEASFTELARQPRMGAPLTLKHPDLAHIRKWRVRDFDNHLVFYEPRPDGVSIVRVLHAASDWWSLLGFVDQRDADVAPRRASASDHSLRHAAVDPASTMSPREGRVRHLQPVGLRRQHLASTMSPREGRVRLFSIASRRDWAMLQRCRPEKGECVPDGYS